MASIKPTTGSLDQWHGVHL